MEFTRALFIIEGGKALELCKAHVTERQRVAAEIHTLLEGLDVAEYWSSRDDGIAMSVRFKGAAHPDFTKPTKHGSRPKKGSEWAKRFAAQKGYDNPSGVIASALNVPLSMSYGKSGNSGWRCLGAPLSECGFLWLSQEGPFAMWTPDIAKEVSTMREQGYDVAEPVKSFRMEFDGCRRIEREEWEILVAQKKLEERRAAKLAA
ncbi:hypothetical protein PQR05_29265 [Paraburkholderia sediminicola]|uniref:hypothetical protein n=1 Tax=Paraburkholderia sediminicola TaxID=458836 RepID=UPI0038B9D972